MVRHALMNNMVERKSSQSSKNLKRAHLDNVRSSQNINPNSLVTTLFANPKLPPAPRPKKKKKAL